MRRGGQRLGVKHRAFGLALQQAQHQGLVTGLHANGVTLAGHGHAQALLQEACRGGVADRAACAPCREGARGLQRQRAFETVVAKGGEDGGVEEVAHSVVRPIRRC